MRRRANGKAAVSARSGSQSDKVSGTQGEPQDAELLRVCARFHALDAKLDRLVALDDPPEPEFVALHEQWMDVLAQALTRPAHTIEGQQARDAVLKAAMAVTLGTLPARSEKARGTTPTILVVDDDAAVVRVIEDHLGSSGFDVITAPDTFVALQRLASHPQIDLCLVDLVMPPSMPDGVTFARPVKSQRPDMPMILMTGYSSAAAKICDLADRLVYKPIDLEILTDEIKHQLQPETL